MKYRNKKIEIDGIKFDSRKEGNRYAQLRILEESGLIQDLKTQVKFCLIPKTDKFRSINYVADFTYMDSAGEIIVEDVKGYRKGQAYALFKVKQKLMYYVNNIEVIEI